jgi:hypothetical protein
LVRLPPLELRREWQASGVRERTQELSSSSFLTPGASSFWVLFAGA